MLTPADGRGSDTVQPRVGQADLDDAALVHVLLGSLLIADRVVGAGEQVVQGVRVRRESQGLLEALIEIVKREARCMWEGEDPELLLLK